MSKRDKKQKHNAPQEQTPVEAVHAHDGEESFVVQPPGQSKLRFILIMGLLVFVLLIFTVGSEVEGVLGGSAGQSGGGTYMSWEDPQSGKHTLSATEFQTRLQSLNMLAQYNLYFPPGTDPNTGRRGRVDEEQTAMWIIDDQRARNLGIAETKDGMRARINAAFGSLEQYENIMKTQRGVSALRIEKALASLIRVEQMRNLVATSLQVADADRVQELWDAAHLEYRFDYVEIPIEELEDKAMEGLPEDEALLAWYHELPDFQQKSYYTKDAFRVASAWIPFEGEFDGAKLSAAFPRPEGEDATQRARNYYNQFSNVRFRFPQPEEETESEGDGGQGGDGEVQDPPVDEEGAGATEETAAEESTDDAVTDDTTTDDTTTDDTTADQGTPVFPKFYYDFEEVEADCVRESELHGALEDWLTDMQRRSDLGEDIDLAAEAALYGVTVQSGAEFIDSEAMTEEPGWGSAFVAGQISLAATKSLIGRVIIDEDAMVVAQFLEKQAGAEPALAEMKEDVSKAWATEQAGELAVTLLSDLRDSFGEKVEGTPYMPSIDADNFKSKSAGTGYEVVERPFLEATALPGNVSFNEATPGDQYIRIARDLAGLEEGQVAEPAKNIQGTHAYLVRAAGERIAPITSMTPQQLEQLRGQAVNESMQKLQSMYFDANSEDVKTRYDIKLQPWTAAEEEADNEASEG
jgi:hypothetical protein